MGRTAVLVEFKVRSCPFRPINWRCRIDVVLQSMDILIGLCRTLSAAYRMRFTFAERDLGEGSMIIMNRRGPIIEP